MGVARSAGGNQEAYCSEELDAPFTISANGNDERLQRETDPVPMVLRMEGPTDEFRAAGLMIRFQRDAAQKVTGFSVELGASQGDRVHPDG